MGGAPYKFAKWVCSLFGVFQHLITKQHLFHVSSNSMPLKQIIGQVITYIGTTTDFEVESWWHTTLWTAPCHSEHGVYSSRCVLHYLRPSMQRSLVVTFGIVLHEVLTSDMHSTWGLCFSNSTSTCSSVGTHLSKLWPYEGFDPEVGRGWAFSWVGTLSQDYGTIMKYT